MAFRFPTFERATAPNSLIINDLLTQPSTVQLLIWLLQSGTSAGRRCGFAAALWRERSELKDSGALSLGARPHQSETGIHRKP
jgi:hypothetical protein